MSGSDSSDSSELSDISFASEDSDGSLSDAAGCYECEPEYTEEELKKIGEVITESSSSEDDLDSSRLENLHWCYCGCCDIGLTTTLVECKCCKEFNILSEKLENLSCITTHKDFGTLILTPSVLEISFIRHRHYQGNFKDFKDMNNK